jgi:hypothetical protein
LQKNVSIVTEVFIIARRNFIVKKKIAIYYYVKNVTIKVIFVKIVNKNIKN